MKKLIICSLVLLPLLWSCGGDDRQARLKVIEDMEEQAFGDEGSFDATKALALVTNYAEFARDFPDDADAPKYLFKAGDFSMGLENAQLAIDYFDQVIEKYPDFEKVPYCMFLKGFIYENQLNDTEEARNIYEEFLTNYPDHEMAESAQFSLKNLGKTPEQLIREFEEQNKPVSDSVPTPV